MFTHIQEFIGSTIPPAEVCIVGAGAAGLELADQLKNTFASITLLESGEESFNWEIQQLCQFKLIGHPIRTPDYSKPFDFKTAKKMQCRLREYGGTLNIWSGKWKTLDPIDFLPKDYIQESGWPISYEEVAQYYSSVVKDYGVSELIQDRESIPKTITSLPDFSPSIALRETQPTNSGIKFHAELIKSHSVRVVLGANVVNINLSEDFSQVKELIVRSLNGHEWKVQSKFFILACGTIENARLLLCSNSQFKEGIGNRRDLVGRFFMDHPRCNPGIFLPFNLGQQFAESLFYDRSKKYELEIGIALHPDHLKKWKLPNHFMYLLPYVIGNIPCYMIDLWMEQLPNIESRVFLSEDVDRLNISMACVDWKFKEMDVLCLKRFLEMVNALLIKNGVGKMELTQNVENMMNVKDTSHQMGTTRMALSCEHGVVDQNCKVFGVDNLFISSSSVFPMGGNANPTLTILALARRLASHLKHLRSHS